MQRRYRSCEIDGAMPAKVELSGPKAGVMPPIARNEAGTSARTEMSDPIGWLIKRLGVLFLVAVTIALVLLIALPRVHATMTSHRGHVLPKALSPGSI